MDQAANPQLTIPIHNPHSSIIIHQSFFVTLPDL